MKSPMAKRGTPCSFPVWLEPRQRTIAYIKWVVFFYLRGRAAGNYPAQHDTEQNPVLTLPSETCTQWPLLSRGQATRQVSALAGCSVHMPGVDKTSQGTVFVWKGGGNSAVAARTRQSWRSHTAASAHLESQRLRVPTPSVSLRAVPANGTSERFHNSSSFVWSAR